MSACISPGSSGENRPTSWARRVQEGLAATLLPTVVFLVVPNAVLHRNPFDLVYTSTIALGLAGSFFGLFTVLWLAYQLAPGCRLARGVVRVSVGLSIGVLVFNALVWGTTGRLDSFVPLLLLDEAAALAIVALVARAPLGPLVLWAAVTGGLLLPSAGVTQGRFVYAAWRAGHTAGAITPHNRAGAAARGNVYHIVLDAFQREAFTVLTAADPSLHPPGFAAVPQFVSQYDMTLYSLASALSGRDYVEGERLSTWVAEAPTDGFWADLHAAGIGVHLYPRNKRQCVPWAASCAFGKSASTEAGIFSTERIFVDLWFVNLVPRSVRRLLTRGLQDLDVPVPTRTTVGFSLTSALFGLPDTSLGPVRFEDYPAHGLLTMRQMLADEAARPGTGQYVFLHVILPHSPYVLDADCGYHAGGAPASSELQAYMAQAACGLRLVREMANTLKELGRFDDALILVHSDHGLTPYLGMDFAQRYSAVVGVLPAAPPGSTVTPDNELKLEPYARNPRSVTMRSRSLLLVKLPSQEAAAVPQGPVQMLDLAPTVLDYFGIDHARYAGLPLSEIGLGADREILFRATVVEHDSAAPEGGTFYEYLLEDGVLHHVRDVHAVW